MRQNRFLWLALAAAMAGAFFSVLSLYEHTALIEGFQAGPSYCNINEVINCDKVNSSEWAVLMGLPLASWGLIFYLGIALMLAYVACRSGGLRDGAADAVLLMGAGAALFSCGLFYISSMLIGALCLNCMGMHAANFGLLICGWAGGKDAPIARRLAAGVRALILFPLVGLGLERQADDRLARAARIGLLAGALLAAGVAYLPALVFVPLLNRGVSPGFAQWKLEPIQEKALRVDLASGQNYFLGRADAPIQILEFADMQCLHCRVFYQTMQSLWPQYGGNLLYVFKNYPLDDSCNPPRQSPGHDLACYAAYFALCAGEQDRYWQALDYLFQLGSMIGSSSGEALRGEIDAGAGVLNIDLEGIKECIESGRYRGQMLSDIELADSLGIPGTPFVFVNGKLLTDHSPQALKQVFDYILSGEKRQGA